MPALNGKVRVVECISRTEHFDADGGGRIVRIIYCEPYTAHKAVLTALKGTVYGTNGAGNKWQRFKPHSDPLYPWFYCTDAQVVEFDKRAARGMPGSGFDPAAAPDPNVGQLPAIQTALNNLDDFDGSAFIDNLVPAEIANGTFDYQADAATQSLNTGETIPLNNFSSRGQCGCFIVATYSPLMFLQGINTTTESGGQTQFDAFDFVDPQWEPITLNTQVGRQLWLYAPDLFGTPNNFNGLVDTFAKPEVIWRFSIRRLMVPFIPNQTISLFSNKVNAAGTLGNLTINQQTWRMETPEIQSCRAPDGQLFHNIRLKFLVRTLWDTAFSFQNNTFSTAPVPITWNHAYGIPSVSLQGGLSSFTPGYYPVVWNDGILQIFGKNRPLFLRDSEVDMTKIANGAALDRTLFGAPFQAGMQTGQ